MSLRALPVLSLVFLSAACGGENKNATTPMVNRPAARTPTPVPAGYAEASERTARAGRAALGLFVDDKLGELHALLQPELAALATVDVLAGVRAKVLEAGAIGRGEDAVFLLGGVRAFIGDVKAGPHVLSAAMSFDERGKLSSLNFIPRSDLPADPHAGRAMKARLRVPFDGQWWVLWGGDSETANYHVVAPDQRHAYDLVMWKDGATHTGDGKQNDQYFCWGQPIVAPADATVVVAEDGNRDNPPGTMDPEHKAGNHVILDLGGGEFALLAHLQQGSVAVKAGDVVKAGQRLGLTGNSGNTSEPHLHFHVQDGPTPFAGNGVPVWFDGVCTDGQPAARTSPVHGQFIEHCR